MSLIGRSYSRRQDKEHSKTSIPEIFELENEALLAEERLIQQDVDRKIPPSLGVLAKYLIIPQTSPEID